jgi:hypothetical protein
MNEMTVKAYKLINGEELIAEIHNETAECIVLKSAASIVLQQTKDGMGVGLAPYMPYVKGNIELHKQSIAASGDPDPNMVNEYNRLFGSGLVMAPASALAGLNSLSNMR